ncbi:hypothetical protein N5D52_04020 [Pseudomonas sp. GD03860]|nr:MULTISPECIES: hypothetical protein [Pseudomonas]MDD2058159.1 hypothetical protein [Pseudomonas putida]MDH0636092.1 hypothetical protein [Pseudomonas sp. GD03860]
MSIAMQLENSTPPRPEPGTDEPPRETPDTDDDKEQYPDDKDMPLPND